MGILGRVRNAELTEMVGIDWQCRLLERDGLQTEEWGRRDRSIQIVAGGEQDGQAIDDDPLDEGHLPLESPGGRVACRVVEERLPERVADGDDVTAPEGTLPVRVQLRGQRPNHWL